MPVLDEQATCAPTTRRIPKDQWFCAPEPHIDLQWNPRRKETTDYAHEWTRKGHGHRFGWEPLPVENPLEELDRHIDIVIRETAHISTMSKIVAHPSYLRVIALVGGSQRLLSALLKHLEQEPYHWFAALEAATGQNPVLMDSDFDESIEAWLNWGRRLRLL